MRQRRTSSWRDQRGVVQTSRGEFGEAQTENEFAHLFTSQKGIKYEASIGHHVPGKRVGLLNTTGVRGPRLAQIRLTDVVV